MGKDKEQEKSPKDKKETVLCMGCGARITNTTDVCPICKLKSPVRK